MPLYPLPAAGGAEMGDVGEVVAAVPLVEEQVGCKRKAAADGVDEAALPLVVRQGLKEHDPAGVGGFDELEGPLDGGGERVVEVGEEVLGVDDDGGKVFGEGELEAEEGGGMRVAEVVNELADGPAGFAVGGIELVVVESGDGVAELLGEVGEGGDGGVELGAGDGAGGLGRGADGVAGVGRH